MVQLVIEAVASRGGGYHVVSCLVEVLLSDGLGLFSRFYCLLERAIIACYRERFLHTAVGAVSDYNSDTPLVSVPIGQDTLGERPMD